MLTIGPSEPLALISTVKEDPPPPPLLPVPSETTTVSDTLLTPSVQVTVKVVDPPTAGYHDSEGAMVELISVDTVDTSGLVIWQAVAPVVARVTVKDSVEVARVRASWPLALISTERVSAKAFIGKLVAKTRSIMNDASAFDIDLGPSAVIGMLFR